MTKGNFSEMELRNSIALHEIASLIHPAFGIVFAIVCLYRGKTQVKTEPTVKDLRNKERKNVQAAGENKKVEEEAKNLGENEGSLAPRGSVHFAFLERQWSVKLRQSSAAAPSGKVL